MKDRQQPTETLDKIVTYMCRGSNSWHHPTFADRLNWSTNDKGGVISPYGIITDWKIVKCSKKVIERLKADMDIGIRI